MDRLAIYKALGDPTRFHLFDLLAASDAPVATSNLATELRLHPNTVRPHLERLREVGLLDVAADKRGTVGRPQHMWEVSADAPNLGDLAPTDGVPAQQRHPPDSLFTRGGAWLLSALMSGVATEAGATSQQALGVGRLRGRAMAEQIGHDLNTRGGQMPWKSCMARCEAGLLSLGAMGGFQCQVLHSDRSKFTVKYRAEACPFGDVMHTYPELTCHLHRGLVEGLSLGLGGAKVSTFHGIEHPITPCQVTLITT